MNPPRQKKILIVDDDPDVRKILTYKLEKQSYAIIEAKDGISGLDMFIEESPNMVMVDVHMPGMDGVQTTAAIVEASRGWLQQPHVFGLTADVLEDAETEFLDAGAKAVLTKPFNMDRVRQALVAVR